MKVIILAAGKGTRMGDLTKDIPKPLIEINNKPFLQYIIEGLEDIGIKDIGIVVNYKKELIASFLEDRETDAHIAEMRLNSFVDLLGANVSLIYQAEPLGTGDAVKACKYFLGGNSLDFLVLNGDSLFSNRDLKSMCVSDGFCYVGSKHSDTPEKYGVLKLDGEYIKKVVEKPIKFVGNDVGVGLFKFTSKIWDALDKLKLSESCFLLLDSCL